MSRDIPKLIILGSAAAEGLPAFFCGCQVCTDARKVGGKEIRNRTSYNFGGKLQIDFGPDIMQAFQRYEEVSRTRHVIITHAHEDHFAPFELQYKAQGFSQTPSSDVLTLYGTDAVYNRLAGVRKGMSGAETSPEILAGIGLAFREIRPFEPFDIPSIGAHIVPLRANHDPRSNPVIYIATMDGRSVLIGNDTGVFPQETRDFLASMPPVRLDVAILDDCACLWPWRDGHMGGESVIEMFDFLQSLGFVTERTAKVVNHFSHNPNMSHVRLEEFWFPKGILVGYDGMVL